MSLFTYYPAQHLSQSTYGSTILCTSPLRTVQYIRRIYEGGEEEKNEPQTTTDKEEKGPPITKNSAQNYRCMTNNTH
jgi:hypothetical protein